MRPRNVLIRIENTSQRTPMLHVKSLLNQDSPFPQGVIVEQRNVFTELALAQIKPPTRVAVIQMIFLPVDIGGQHVERKPLGAGVVQLFKHAEYILLPRVVVGIEPDVKRARHESVIGLAVNVTAVVPLAHCIVILQSLGSLIQHLLADVIAVETTDVMTPLLMQIIKQRTVTAAIVIDRKGPMIGGDHLSQFVKTQVLAIFGIPPDGFGLQPMFFNVVGVQLFYFAQLRGRFHG